MTQKIMIPEYLKQNGMPEYVITSGSHPIGHPFEYYHCCNNIYCNSNMYYRQYEHTIDQAVIHFVKMIDQLDTGAVQLWKLNKNNDTYYEMGSLYL